MGIWQKRLGKNTEIKVNPTQDALYIYPPPILTRYRASFYVTLLSPVTTEPNPFLLQMVVKTEGVNVQTTFKFQGRGPLRRI